VSLNPQSAHLYNTELPISFSVSMSPPQHAHFIITYTKDERLFVALVDLTFGPCLYIFLSFFSLCYLIMPLTMISACRHPFSHRIVVILPLCTSFYRHYISSSRKANKYERHNIGMSLKAYLKQHLVLLGNIFLNEEYEITLLKCNNA